MFRSFMTEQIPNFTREQENYPTEDVIVSLMFTESANNFLHLDLPHIEDLLHERNAERPSIIDKTSSTDDFTTYQLLPNFYKDLPIDVAYVPINSLPTSSTSILNDDISVDNFDEDIEQPSDILHPITVHMRLLTINSLAHENKILGSIDGIYVSELESELTVTKSGWINVCRICHGGESSGKLVGACRCRGSVALTHINCLERWLKESANSNCELCNYHFQIIREPKYSIFLSILMFLKNPENHAPVLIVDLLTFLVYTPTVIVSTYMLMILCDTITKTTFPSTKKATAHFMTFFAIFGMALIDFTYSSWILTMAQRHSAAWTEWYKRHCTLKLILPKRKMNQYLQHDKSSL